MNEILERISKIGIIPVILLKESKDAVPLAEALMKGGLACAEVTFRSDAAEESIRQMAEKFPEMLVGAGTVLTTEQVDKAVSAGAKFIVSPGLNPKIVKYCMERNIIMVPGIVTPSEVEQALELGLDVVKFFPAEPSGGLEMIKAISAPYKKIKFIPTGGINEENVSSYLCTECILACGGTWMVKSELIENGAFHEVMKLAKEARDLADKARSLKTITN